MLRAVHSCKQLLIGKTDVCGGQAEGTGDEEEHLPPSQLPHTHEHMTHVTVLQPLALSGISPDYTVLGSRFGNRTAVAGNGPPRGSGE